MRSLPLHALVLLSACGEKPAQGPDMVTTDPEASPVASQSVAPAATPSTPSAVVSPSSASEAPLPVMQALGTEPFWSIRIEGGKLTWSSPEDMPGTPFTTASGKARDGGWRYVGTLKGEPAELVIAPGKCSDGMSDTVYPYTARLALGTQRLSGCARKR